jgi:AAA+ ATPase superfamily predicted ATPase
VPFIDREEEIEFFVDWFREAPQRILFVYGPKSSGKTTVIEYVVEKRLLTEKEWWVKGKYWVKYLNLRRKIITSYNSFLEALIVPEEIYKETVETNVKLSLGLISIDSRKIADIYERKRNLFDVLTDEIAKEQDKGKTAILIIDELQKLRDIYINGERELLKEFLNFCVSLTKETHLCHVVILTSNTVFIEKLYNDAKMKKTSLFYKIAHLSKEKIEEWLKLEGFNEKDAEIIWDYLGGCIADILRVFSIRKNGKKDLKEFLEEQKWLAYTDIDEYLAEFSEKETEFLLKVAKEIVEKGYFSISGLKIDKRKLLQKWAEKEILFYDPLELKVTGNSRIYEKGMELLLERYT